MRLFIAGNGLPFLNGPVQSAMNLKDRDEWIGWNPHRMKIAAEAPKTEYNKKEGKNTHR